MAYINKKSRLTKKRHNKNFCRKVFYTSYKLNRIPFLDVLVDSYIHNFTMEKKKNNHPKLLST